MNSPLSQEIYVDIIFDSDRMSLPNTAYNRLILEESNYELDNTLARKSLSVYEELEDTKRNLESVKSSIHDYQSQIDKLNHQLNNLTTNTSIYDIKSNGVL